MGGRKGHELPGRRHSGRLSGAVTEDNVLQPDIRGETLHWVEAAEGRPIRVVVGLDAEDFDERFLACVETAQR